MPKKKTQGFGFDPGDSQHHFLWIRESDKDRVVVFERFKWNEGDKQEIDHRFDKPKVSVSIDKWHDVSSHISEHFNARLEEDSKKKGNWRPVQVPLHLLMGKEMVLLLWAIEDLDPGQVHTAVRNWLGLRPEERWWLFTMTNAATGGIDDRRGWRKAIKFALAENPVLEAKRQHKLTDFLQ